MPRDRKPQATLMQMFHCLAAALRLPLWQPAPIMIMTLDFGTLECVVRGKSDSYKLFINLDFTW